MQIMPRAWVVLVFIVTVSFACGSAQSPPSPYQPVASVKQLMLDVIDPAADVVWDSVGTIVTADGIEELYPKTEEDWNSVRGSALILAEAGNLLMMEPRARDNEEWMEMSQAIVDAGSAAVSAAEAEDVERIFALGEDIYYSCDNCHMKYDDM